MIYILCLRDSPQYFSYSGSSGFKVKYCTLFEEFVYCPFHLALFKITILLGSSMAKTSFHSITFDYAAVFKKRKCIILRLHGAICALTLSEAQWFCCQKVPPLSWCRALPLLLVPSPPTSADSPAGGASSPQQLPLVGSVEVVQLLQQPSVSRPHNGLWSATAQYVSAPIAAGETQEGQYCKSGETQNKGHYCKSALHLNSKATPKTQWRVLCSRRHSTFLHKGTLHCFNGIVCNN